MRRVNSLPDRKCKIYNCFYLEKITATLLFLTSSYLIAQELETKLPGNVSINNFFQNPSLSAFTDYSSESLVDLYTGMVDVNIPIYTIVDKDLKIPITLKYRKNGIKVKEYSGRVGLGWNIVTGGYIIREVRGNPDEEIKAISPKSGVEYYQNLGRYVDLMDLIYPDNVIDNDQIPLGNYGGNKSIDYYSELLKNGSISDCESPRVDHNPHLFNSNFNRSEKCEAILVDALKQNPHISAVIFPFGPPNIIYFWNQYRDTQPDIFHYSTPTESGSFILDDQGNPLIINGAEDVIIKPGIGPNADPEGWKITTSDGITSLFPTSLSYVEKSVTSTLNTAALSHTSCLFSDDQTCSNYDDKGLSQKEFKDIPVLQSTNLNGVFRVNREVVNTWYLSKINSSKYQAEVSFHYSSQADIEDYEIEENKMNYVRTVSKQYAKKIGASGTQMHVEISHTKTIDRTQPNGYNLLDVLADQSDLYYFPILKTVKNPKYISKITFKGGEVSFLNQTTPRADMKGNYALDKIRVSNYSKKRIKEFKFEYNYFIELPYLNMSESSRLKLKKFYEVSGNESLGKYSFEYNENNKLPPNNSKKQDYWGYFNNNTSNSLIPKGSRHYKSFSGADRSPNEEKMKTWMLKKIAYPTGGSNEFFYEINKYLDKEYNIETAIGGLRVKKTISDNNDRQTIVKNYSYSSGRTNHFLDRNWWRHFQSDSHFLFFKNLLLKDFHYIKRSSSNIYPMLQTNGGWVGYGKVTVEQLGNGKTEYEFTNSVDFPDLESSKVKYPYITQNGSDLYHDNTHISLESMRGLLKSILIKDNNNKPIYYEKNEYQANPKNYSQVNMNSIKIEPQFSFNVGWNAFQGAFTSDGNYMTHSLIEYGIIKSYFPFRKKTTKRQFDSDGIGYNEVVYEYKKEGNTHMQITETSLTEADNKKIKIKNYYTNDNYPKQYLDSVEKASIDKMKGQNRIETILIEKFKSGHLLFRKMNTYKILDEIVLLKSNKASKGANTLEDNVVYHSYDAIGNPKEVSKKGGVHTVYIWGYNKSLPIAKIENATYTEVVSGLASLSGSSDTIETIQAASNTDTNTTTETTLRNKLNKLRQALPKAMVTTYTYDPLVGITSMTDPRGNVIYYEYDDFNRLKLVKDKNGHIVSENQYHYKNKTLRFIKYKPNGKM